MQIKSDAQNDREIKDKDIPSIQLCTEHTVILPIEVVQPVSGGKCRQS